MSQKNFILSTYSYLTTFIGLNLGLFIGTVLFAYLAADHSKDIETNSLTAVIIYLSLAAIFLIALIISFVLTVRAGWISPILFYQDKASQRQHGKLYDWHWSDITEIHCRTHRGWPFKLSYDPPMFKLKCSKHKLTLTFVATPQVIKQFTAICTNQAINQQFEQLLSQCDFYYFGKNNNK